MYSNFLLGQLKLSNEAKAALKRVPLDLYARHAVNDHGTITARERKVNELSMLIAGPVVSRYRVDPTNPSSLYVRVSTTADWSSTSITLE